MKADNIRRQSINSNSNNVSPNTDLTSPSNIDKEKVLLRHTQESEATPLLKNDTPIRKRTITKIKDFFIDFIKVIAWPFVALYSFIASIFSYFNSKKQESSAENQVTNTSSEQANNQGITVTINSRETTVSDKEEDLQGIVENNDIDDVKAVKAMSPEEYKEGVADISTSAVQAAPPKNMHAELIKEKLEQDETVNPILQSSAENKVTNTSSEQANNQGITVIINSQEITLSLEEEKFLQDVTKKTYNNINVEKLKTEDFNNYKKMLVGFFNGIVQVHYSEDPRAESILKKVVPYEPIKPILQSSAENKVTNTSSEQANNQGITVIINSQEITLSLEEEKFLQGIIKKQSPEIDDVEAFKDSNLNAYKENLGFAFVSEALPQKPKNSCTISIQEKLDEAPILQESSAENQVANMGSKQANNQGITVTIDSQEITLSLEDEKYLQKLLKSQGADVEKLKTVDFEKYKEILVGAINAARADSPKNSCTISIMKKLEQAKAANPSLQSSAKNEVANTDSEQANNQGLTFIIGSKEITLSAEEENFLKDCIKQIKGEDVEAVKAKSLKKYQELLEFAFNCAVLDLSDNQHVKSIQKKLEQAEEVNTGLRRINPEVPKNLPKEISIAPLNNFNCTCWFNSAITQLKYMLSVDKLEQTLAGYTDKIKTISPDLAENADACYRRFIDLNKALERKDNELVVKELEDFLNSLAIFTKKVSIKDEEIFKDNEGLYKASLKIFNDIFKQATDDSGGLHLNSIPQYDVVDFIDNFCILLDLNSSSNSVVSKTNESMPTDGFQIPHIVNQPSSEENMLQTQDIHKLKNFTLSISNVPDYFTDFVPEITTIINDAKTSKIFSVKAVAKNFILHSGRADNYGAFGHYISFSILGDFQDVIVHDDSFHGTLNQFYKSRNTDKTEEDIEDFNKKDLATRLKIIITEAGKTPTSVLYEVTDKTEI